MGGRILIVDDDEPFRVLASELLTMSGFDVVAEAADGASALAAAQRLRPDIVLLDVQLPDHDGFEVARKLHAGTHTPAVILVSSRDRGAYRQRLADSDVAGFIPKAELSAAAIAALVG
jgi:DNA-binding NarL/FixJ family response regulator